MNKEALEFYIESKNLLADKVQSKLAEDKTNSTSEKLAFIADTYEEKQANFKENTIKFIKAHPKATENAIVGGLMGGGSELAMPSQYDMTGQPATNMSRIGKRALLGAAMGGVGGEIKSNVRGHISKLAGFSDLLGKMRGMGSSVGNALKSPVGKGALIGGATFGVPLAEEGYIQQKLYNEGKVPDYVQGTGLNISPGSNALISGLAGALPGAVMGGLAGRAVSKMHPSSIPSLLSSMKPNTSSVSSFLKDPVVRDSLIGGGAGAAMSAGMDYRDVGEGQEYHPNISKMVQNTLLGAGGGAVHGTFSKGIKQMDTLTDMMNIARNTKTPPKGQKYLPLDRAHLPVMATTADGAQVLAKQASRAALGLGGAALGGLVGYAGSPNKKKDKWKSGLAGAAVLGGLGTLMGQGRGTLQKSLDLAESASRFGKEHSKFRARNVKTAGMLSPMLQRAGGMIAKNPRAASAVLGAGAGLASNELTGADAPVFSAVAGGALGALGGKQLLRATVNRAKPLLGKDVASGAVNVMKQNRASQLALKPPTSVNMGATQQAAAKMKPVANTQAARTLPVGKGSTNYNTTASSLPSQTSFNPTQVASNKPQTNLPGVSFREGPVASPVMPQKQDPMAGYRPSRSTIPQLAPQRGSMAKSTFDPSLAQTMSKLAHIMKW
jgi:hypothetical protein